MNINKTSKGSRKSLIIVFICAVLMAGIVATYFFITRNIQSEVKDRTITHSEATDQEKKEAEDHKKDIAENNNVNQSPDDESVGDSKKTVTPFVTAWGQASEGSDFKLNGFVPDIIETDGKCTLTMTKGDKKATKTRIALADAKNTTCGQTVIPYSDLEPGEWKAILSYNSPHSSGSSEVTMVEVK